MNKTTIARNAHGWIAETFVPFSGEGEIKTGDRCIRVSTHKVYSGGFVTTVMGCVITDYYGYTYVSYQDYHKTVAKSTARCTEKAVTTQHNEVLAQPGLFDEIRKHYASEA